MDEQEEKRYFALRERDQWMKQCLEAEAERDRYRADPEVAAGELLLPMPDPGTDMAKLMSANAILRARVAQRDQLIKELKECPVCDAAIKSLMARVAELEDENGRLITIIAINR